MITLEPLLGSQPCFLLECHPAEPLAAMQAFAKSHYMNECSAIWNLESGKIVWAPENAIAIGWLPGYEEVCLVRCNYQHDPKRHKVIATPLQSEFCYFFERWTWPAKKRLTQLKIELPTGWPAGVVAAPTGKYVVMLWRDQCQAGVEIIEVAKHSDQQLKGQGYRTGTNRVDLPAFSPSARYCALVCVYELIGSDFARDPGSYKVRAKVGHVALRNAQTASWTELEIEDEFSKELIPAENQASLYGPWEVFNRLLDIGYKLTFAGESFLRISSPFVGDRILAVPGRVAQ
jgi:hypothetical protein